MAQSEGSTIKRVAPNEVEEVYKNRVICTHVKDVCKVFLEVGAFSDNLGMFSDPHIMAPRVYEKPLS